MDTKKPAVACGRAGWEERMAVSGAFDVPYGMRRSVSITAL